MTRTLLSPLRAGVLDLAHRVVMAPLTRMRAALPGNTPHALNVEYYRQRASKGGLLITEGSQISPMAQGLPATPGIHSRAQMEGWSMVSGAIHAEGGQAFLQQRIRLGARLNPYHRPTFYGGDGKGYIDYPRLDAANA